MRVDRRAGYAAWIWVIAFIAAHIYWFAGGRIGHPNALPPLSFSLFAVIVAGMFLVGAVVPLESVHEWGSVIPRPMLLTLLWAGSVVLLLRGAAGIVDEALRMTGISPNGLTGLTRAQVTGSANPSAGVLWSGRAIDAYFVLGGLLFGMAARSYQRRSLTSGRGPQNAA